MTRRRWTALTLIFASGCSVLVDNELDGKNAKEILDAGDRTDARPGREDAGPSDAEEPDATAEAGEDATVVDPANGANVGFTISLGRRHGCALSPRGEVTCWGSDEYGQLQLPADSYQAISAGDAHTCAVTTAGALVCVGSNSRGQRANDPGPFVEVAAGSTHTCARAESGAVTCFGDGVEGQATPPSGVKFDTISAGLAVTCGIERTSHALSCFGRGKTALTNAADGLALAALDVGDNIVCAVERDTGAAFCWGEGNEEPPALPSPAVAIAVSIDRSACALLVSGDIACWPDIYTPPITFGDGPFVGLAGNASGFCAIPAESPGACWAYDPLDALAQQITPDFP